MDPEVLKPVSRASVLNPSSQPDCSPSRNHRGAADTAAGTGILELQAGTLLSDLRSGKVINYRLYESMVSNKKIFFLQTWEKPGAALQTAL